MAWYGLSSFSWRCRNITTNFCLTIGNRVLIYIASGSAFCIHFFLTEEQLSSWGYGDPCHLLAALASCLFCHQLHPLEEGYLSGEHCIGIRSTFCWDSKNLTLSRTKMKCMFIKTVFQWKVILFSACMQVTQVSSLDPSCLTSCYDSGIFMGTVSACCPVIWALVPP